MRHHKDFVRSVQEVSDLAVECGENNLAIVLLTYLGSEKIGMDSHFAANCQEWAKDSVEKVKMIRRGVEGDN